MLIERMRRRLAADTKFIEPCLPSPADRPPSGSNWIHEVKHDGYRLMARRRGPRKHKAQRRFTPLLEVSGNMKIGIIRYPSGLRTSVKGAGTIGAKSLGLHAPKNGRLISDRAMCSITPYPCIYRLRISDKCGRDWEVISLLLCQPLVSNPHIPCLAEASQSGSQRKPGQNSQSVAAIRLPMHLQDC
jgi:hypothetical protein